MPKTAPKRWKGALKTFLQWVEAKGDGRPMVDVTTLQAWAVAVNKKGQSQDIVYNCTTCINAILAAQGRPTWGTMGTYQTLARLDTKWHREYGKDTYWVSEEELENYVAKVPPHVEKERWEAKHRTAHAFGLRHEEVNELDPLRDITYRPDLDAWVAEIRAPKIDKHRKIQHVCIKGEWCSSATRTLFYRFLAKHDLSWKGKWSNTCDLKYLRYAVGVKAEQRNQSVLYHSLRHGRITELKKLYMLSNDQLVAFGRWVRPTNVLVYNHY